MPFAVSADADAGDGHSTRRPRMWCPHYRICRGQAATQGSSCHARLCRFWGKGDLQLWPGCFNHCLVTFSCSSLIDLQLSGHVGRWAACNMLLACVQPSPVLCNQLTNAWSKTGAAGEIRAVMASMRLMGMRPDVYTWSSLVHAHAVARQTGRYTALPTAMPLLLLHTRAAVMLLLQSYCCCCAHARSVCE